jgi:dCMP deaminase
MKNRPSFHTIYLGLANQLAKRSTCSRLSVGTVITTTDHRKVLSCGYNGGANGQHNGCDRSEAGNCGCIHAECNAVINCDSPREIQKIVYITHFPCEMCCKILVNLGNVKQVFYGEQYRNMSGIKILMDAGIDVCKWKE